MRSLRLLVLAAALFIGLVPVVSLAQQFDQSAFAGMQWRMIGPFRGGRVNAVSGVPGQPNTFYFGSVGGGLWKSARATPPGFSPAPSH